MNYRLNPIFTISKEEKQKYRALQLLPSKNLSGDWMCSVASYYHHDVRMQNLKVISPEKSFFVQYHEVKIYKTGMEIILIICKVNLISPEPSLKIL
jgi:hypothetical protein